MSGRERIVAAMSGGVDSSVAAALLIEQGFDVVGVTLQLQPCREITAERSCCSANTTDLARTVAARLGIAHYVLDCRKQFEEEVLRYSWTEYSRGRTPNPCVLCNQKIKFGRLLDFARSIGARAVATGHYARIDSGAEGDLCLRRGSFAPKDQSYFLFSLSKAQLASAMFPVGHLDKDRVRAMSGDLGFEGAVESQDACFAVKGKCYAELLRQRFDGPAKPGNFVNSGGAVLGSHTGIHQFTVGQRQKLGLTLGERCWVKAIDEQTGSVHITTDGGDLLASGLTASIINWNGPPVAAGAPLQCQVRVRYRQTAAPAQVEFIGPELVRVEFQNAIRAVTPGQAAVFYDGDRVLGGGWIESSFQA